MIPAGRLALCGLALAAGSIAAFAQPAVISARSGLIHYVEGQVFVDDQPVDSRFGAFQEVKEKQVLRTEEGRAEVLLTPGVFLRLGENSSFRMITNRLIDTRLEFLSGSAIVEADNIGKDNSITVVYQDTTVHPAKKGLYRLDASPAALKVYEGTAEVAMGDKSVEARDGHLVALDTLALSRFDKTETDALNRWSGRRADYDSMASVGAANSLRTSSMFSADSAFNNGWYWNPFLGMYTFVPGGDGLWYNAYGYPFWSPNSVYMAYMPGYYYPYYGGYYPGYSGIYNSIGGYNTVPVPSHSGRVGTGGSIGPGGGESAGLGHGAFAGTSAAPPALGVSAPASHGGAGGGGGHR